MTLEVEQKFYMEDRLALEKKLRDMGAVKTGSFAQQDVYLIHPSRDLASTDEAFRIRYDPTQTLICYKGPRQPGRVKIREEIEVPVSDGHIGNVRKLFNHLGFAERATVRKNRDIWQIPQPDSLTGPITVALDIVEQVGEFAEVELVVAEHLAEQASQQVFSVAAELGLTRNERRSYIAMLLASMS